MKNKNNDEWIIRCLNRYNNCFVNEKHNFKKIEKKMNKELLYLKVPDGYIIKVKEVTKDE